MNIIGFNFSKISAEKLSEIKQDTKINTNIHISDIAELKPDFFKTKEELVKVEFVYTVDYSGDCAKVEIKGNLILNVNSKESKNILRDWKEKKLDEDLRYDLFNAIMKKSTLKALELEDEIHLPLHAPLFSLKRSEKQ